MRDSLPPPSRVEWVVAPQGSPDTVADAKHCKSTLLVGSQHALRERSLYDAYAARVTGPHRDAILNIVPGQWLPLDAARAHYTACDSLALPTETLIEIGAAATRKAHGTMITFVRRVAQGAGVSPWAILAQSQRFWSNMWDGGCVSVERLAPKDARVHIVGYPLAGIPYNRVTMRGILIAGAELFCSKVFAKELPSMCDERCLGLHVSWS